MQSTSHISPWIAAFSKKVDNPGTASEPKRSFGGEHPHPCGAGRPFPAAALSFDLPIGLSHRPRDGKVV